MSPAPTPKAVSPKKRKPRLARRFFGAMGLCLALAGLAVVAALWWLSQVGLPEVVKQRLVAEVQHAGWSVDFTRLRWSLRRGLVVENLLLERAGTRTGPKVFAESAQCLVDGAALRSLQLRVAAVRVAGGRLLLPLSDPNQPLARVVVSGAEGALRFRSADVWELDDLRASLWGVRVNLNGRLTNAGLVREWKLPRRDKQAGAAFPAWWGRLAVAAEEWRFGGVPELSGNFRADAGHLARCEADLRFTLPAVAGPYGAGTNLWLTARLAPAKGAEAETRVKLRLTAGQARTRWGSAESLVFQATLQPALHGLLPTNSVLRLEVRKPRTPWGEAASAIITHQFLPCATNDAFLETLLTVQATQLQAAGSRAADTRIEARVSHLATNWLPATVSGALHAEGFETRWARARQSEWTFRAVLPQPGRFRLAQTNLVWPERLADVELEATVLAHQVQAGQFAPEQLWLTNRWQDGRWELALGGELNHGLLSAQADLDTPSRELNFQAHSTLDPFQFISVLSTNVQGWLARAQWQVPPQLSLQGRLIWPAWTNRAPDWSRDVLPTLALAGRCQTGPCAVNGTEFQAIDLPFAFTNLALELPEAVLSRAEGRLEGAFGSDLRTGDFHARLRSGIDPAAVKPWLAGKADLRALDLARFTAPPAIEGEVWGRLGEPGRLGVRARFEATNFTFRGEYIGRCRTGLAYTNQLLELLEPRVERPGETGAAPALRIDLAKGILYLTNAQGNLDPYALTRAIGAKTARAIAPYQYETPPWIILNGEVDLKPRSQQDHLRFQVAGGAFHWAVFQLQTLQGEVALDGESVVLTNVTGTLYGGGVQGSARFDFGDLHAGTDLAFELRAEDLNLRSLMLDISPYAKTNRLDGTLSGVLVVDYANAADPKTWQGEGSLRLLNGLIWDIPVFGLFSPVLNTFAPGLGNSRAREGSATFIITNSVIYSRDLRIHATAMRMQFQGSVDFAPRVEGRMEAELLRDLPGIGLLVSKVLWPVTKLFEYKLTGPLHDPKMEPVYLLPKLILLPLHPLRGLKDLLVPEPAEAPKF